MQSKSTVSVSSQPDAHVELGARSCANFNLHLKPTAVVATDHHAPDLARTDDASRRWTPQNSQSSRLLPLPTVSVRDHLSFM
jgi:hypothetical protein